ncbi:fgf-3 [Psilogramma increta granulovirus]|uniref:Fgf-3 n=1 Tax=Psilogramma increta granulovirus TaxID=2953508 RepID=A0A977XVL8_9BBAC|nr:fgf-3 [Psilogramma increta granulovirus]
MTQSVFLFFCCFTTMVVATDSLSEGSGDDVESLYENDWLMGVVEPTKIKPTATINTTSDINTTTTIEPTTTTIVTIKPTIINFTNLQLETFNEDKGEMYKADKKLIQLYQIIDGTRVYLDGSNNQVGQYVVTDLYTHQFLNFILYTLYRNTMWDTDDQIVLRHELSLNYFCLTNCGVVYMSYKLTRDCVFRRELAQDITATLETIYLRKQIPDGPLLTLNMDYGSVNFKNFSTFYVEEQHVMWNEDEYNLSPLMDEANADVCEYNEDDSNNDNHITYSYANVNNKDMVKATVNLTILIGCLTVTILIVGLLIITVYVYKHKKNIIKNMK